MRKLAVCAALTLSLSGCVLAPQVIQLNQEATVTAGQLSLSRDALVRVVDDREIDGRQPKPNELGSRGGRLAENSPLNSENSLKDVLTMRMQNSLTQLGFGAASPLEPLKLQLSVKEFSYGCNDGMMVNDCSVRMRFELTVIDGATTFTKPYGANESRRVATAPVKEYNEKWVNEVLDRLWQYMFNDDELRAALGVQ